jgi:hypothetical protein
MIFDNDVDWRCKAVKASNLLVPDSTVSNVNDWTVCVVRASYQVHELYNFIRSEEHAEKAGWNVEQARKAIIKASPEDHLSSEHAWEWYQQQIRNNDLSFSAKCDVVRVDHVYYREFPDDENPEGAISHCIINERGEAKEFLFRKVKRYEKWDEAVHCLYYDKGDGLHHSVKGMGVKMYSTLELKNRLKCTMVDASVARAAIHLIPDSANAMNRINVMNLGPYSVLPANMQVQQTSIAGSMDAPMQMDDKLEGGIQASLSQYRQRLEKDGNPRTATEIEAIMSQQSTLGKTQINRYYTQLDALFAEKYRRAINTNLTKDRPGGAAALKFQKACRDRGVTSAILKKATSVQTTRSAGRGSQFAKQAVMNQLMGLIGMLPEGGRQNVIEDTIASMAGYNSLERYFPQPKTDLHTDEEQQHAAYENIMFKSGGIIPVSSGDNHAIHAGAHLQAGMEVASAVNEQESINPMEVATFLRALLEHTNGHLAELSQDQTREGLLKVLSGHFGELSGLLEDMLSAINEQAQAAQQEGAEAGEGRANVEAGLDPKDQLAQAKFEREEARRDAKNEADIERKATKARQDLALKDAKTAAKIMEGK